MPVVDAEVACVAGHVLDADLAQKGHGIPGKTAFKTK